MTGSIDPPGPLADVLVLDVTRVLAGPYATMVLADLGAEVIKIERPPGGDDSRAYPPFKADASAYFASINRGKKSVALDLGTAMGRDVFLGLAEQADVVVENFRPGTMERLGLGYDVLRKGNRRLIFASCSGFGRTGPFAEKPAYDVVVQAMGGLLGITGEEDGGPVRVGVSIGDLSAALFLVIGILAALRTRALTGEGQHVDVAMLDSVVALLENAIVRNDLEPDPPGRLGTRHPSIAPFQAFPTADGHIAVAAGNETLWRRLCSVLGMERLAADAAFSSNRARVANHEALEAELGRLLTTRRTDEWVELLDGAGIPCGPVNGVGDVIEHPQVKARDMLLTVADTAGHDFRVAGSPLKLSQGTVRPQGWVPSLGQHTEEVLRLRLGMDPAAIEALLLDAPYERKDET